MAWGDACSEDWAASHPGQVLPTSCNAFKTSCAPTMRLLAKMGSWVLQTRCLKTAKLSPLSSAETFPSWIINSQDFKRKTAAWVVVILALKKPPAQAQLVNVLCLQEGLLFLQRSHAGPGTTTPLLLLALGLRWVFCRCQLEITSLIILPGTKREEQNRLDRKCRGRGGAWRTPRVCTGPVLLLGEL